MDQNPPGSGASSVQSRRRVLRTAAALVTMAVAAAADSQVARASRGWCRSDPLILIEGVVVDIFCTAPPAVLLQASGPTEIVVSLPVGVKPTLVLAGVGFGRGENVRFEETERLQRSDTAIPLEVAVYVPARKSLAIGVEFARNLVGILEPVRAEGATNQWITLATQLPIDTLLAAPLGPPSPGDSGLGSLLSGNTRLVSQSSGKKRRRTRDGRSHPRRNRKRKRH
jgi:hypothetical protein